MSEKIEQTSLFEVREDTNGPVTCLGLVLKMMKRENLF